MRNKIFVMILLIIIGCGEIEKEQVGNKQNVVDDLGHSFSADSVPQRVITLAPNLTEMIYELGVGSKLIGNTLYCNYPEQAKDVEKVGDLLTINYEKILELKPDIIFLTVEGNTKEGYNKLTELGLNVFISNPRDFKGIKKTILDLSRLFKKEKMADSLIQNWNERLNHLKKVVDKNSHKSAMFLVSLQPIMLAGNNTYINEFLKFCGLKNITEDTDVNYPMFSREQVLVRNPDYIFYSDGMKKDEKDFKNAYPEWKNLSAVKKGNVIFIDSDLYFRPGPRFIIALEDLAASVYNLN
jgi:iron complex transport system substrate-binding protein